MWVAYPLSRESSWPRNQTGVSWITGGFFTSWATREAPNKSKDKFISGMVYIQRAIGSYHTPWNVFGAHGRGIPGLGCCSMFHMGDMDSDCTWLPGSPAADRGGWGWGALMYGVQGRSLSCSDRQIVLTADIREKITVTATEIQSWYTAQRILVFLGSKHYYRTEGITHSKCLISLKGRNYQIWLLNYAICCSEICWWMIATKEYPAF